MSHLQKEIEHLKKLLLALCAKVEENVHKAVKSFENMDTAMAASIIDSDKEIDAKEVEVEEECLKAWTFPRVDPENRLVCSDYK